MGIMGGCGRQATTANVGFVAWYAVGLPAAAAFAFYFELQLLGIWIGLTCGLLFSVCTIGMCVGRMNWEAQAAKAVKNAASKESVKATLIDPKPGPDGFREEHV
jgi:MATE family multidrug resistance protein